ncbi:MAG: response regulator [Nitrospirae bacterium]|nr:response regulator [Nitrospirota bacterium]
MTDHILQKKIPTVIPDIQKYSFVDNEVLLNEGIKSLVCVPLIASENIIGILYIDDFKTRSWTQREIDFLTLLGIQAAYAIEKFSLIERISETQNYLKNVLDNSADMIITTDQAGVVVEFNKGASKLLGYLREEIIGTPVETLWEKPEDRRRIMKAIEASGSILNYETRLKTKEGKLIDVSLTLSFIKNAAGEIIGTVGISKDITEKKRLELAIHERSLELQDLNERLEEKVLERTRELERANRELERSNKLKSQFIATMSHELRTPLNSILGFSELLVDEVFGPLNEKQKRYVGNIYNSGSHLLQLINNVLDIAKIESGKMELSYEAFSVAQSISEVQTVIKSLADKKAQKITIKIGGDVSIIKADKIKFKQILYNILSNGVKFTPEGGEITVSAEMLDTNNPAAIPEKVHSYLGPEKCLKISVTDTGIGIREEDQERVFSEFEQVDSSHSRKYEGTGLGLALTKKLVELHGGAIFVESEEGKGSTFTVIIPPFDVSSVNSEIQSLPVADELNYEGEPETARRSEYPLILVAEDDRATSEIITLSLVREGYRVAHAYTGMEVISKVRDLKPFAIILDVMLPEKDGWEVIQELKLDHELKDIPVIISSVVDNKDLGFALGAADYLVKPVEKNTLLSRIKDLSKRKRGTSTTILCIDDNEQALELLVSILETADYSIITATSGKQGLEKAIAFKPDIIILDLMMPEVDGFEVAQTLKNHPGTVDIPILVLTAKDLTVDDKMRLAGKIESFIQKSHFTKDDLLMHIKDLEVTYPTRAGLLDEVSGLFDHSYFQIRLAQEVGKAARYKDVFTLVMIDLDNFTDYIKYHGIHRANICIKKIAEFLRKSLRNSDTLVPSVDSISLS